MSLRYIIGINDIKTVKTFCEGMSFKKPDCMAAASVSLVQVDPINVKKSLEVCGFAKDKQTCYSYLAWYSHDNLKHESQELLSYCSALPSPWNTKCIKYSEDAASQKSQQ